MFNSDREEIISASAGSGKTAAMLDALANRGLSIKHVPMNRTTTVADFIAVNGESALAKAIRNGEWIIIDEFDYPSFEKDLLAINEQLA